MPETKQLLCLANSQKYNGFCLAGMEVGNGRFGNWVRPVSEEEHGELKESDLICEDGGIVSVGDIFLITLKGHCRHSYQSENFLIDDGYYCKKTGQSTWHDFKEIACLGQRTLWTNGFSSSNGVNDKVPLKKLSYPEKSLRFLYLDTAILSYQKEFKGQRKCRLEFSYQGNSYRLMVTDPEVKDLFFEKEEESYELQEAYCCVSLGEPFYGYAYKLVASIITKERLKDGGIVVYYRSL
jgi:hypothetical protein